MSGAEILEDQAWSDDWDEDKRRCDVCDGELDINEFYVCDECTGLRHCADDMCHGLGYCMHDANAVIP